MAESKYIEDGQILEKVTQDSSKKTVFLIGDSIRDGYRQTVRNELAAIANVVFPEENCRYTQYVLTSLCNWAGLCDPDSVDLVHFNCGHWDVAHWGEEEFSLNTEEVYAANIGRIIQKLRKLFPRAKIVFATTTAMNPTGIVNVNPRTNAEIERYNAAGVKAALENGARVYDLYAFTKDWDKNYFADHCHFTQAAFAVLGRRVSDEIKMILQNGDK